MFYIKTCVFSTALYACETWTIKKTDKDKIFTFEMYCYRRILHLNWTMKVTNREVRERLKFNIKAELMHTVMKRKRKGLFGHVCRIENSRKMKSVMLGIIDGKGRHGRSNIEWIDDIKEWCKNNLFSLTISTRDRKFWKQTMTFALDTYGYQPMDHDDDDDNDDDDE